MTIYGNPARVPTPESEPADPVAYYGITKWAAERYVHLTARRSDLARPLHVTSFRMFNVYGPRQSLTNAYQGVLAIFLGQCLRGETIAIHSDGTQSRDFVYVADVVRAWLAAIDEARSHDRVLNLGSGTPTSINELCAGVLARFDHTPESYGVTHEPQQQGDVRESAADIAAAREVLGWSPEVALAEGLAETVRWARKNLDASGRANAPRIPEPSTAPTPRRK
jgi:UDP-glucose 4-epimerase